MLSLTQWRDVAKRELGLRAAEGPEDLKGAGFALTDMADPKTFIFGPVPEDWDQKLLHTINVLIAFSHGYGRPQLLLLRDVIGTSREYRDCFPKQNLVTNAKVEANIPFEGNDAQQLVDWVMAKIDAA